MREVERNEVQLAENWQFHDQLIPARLMYHMKHDKVSTSDLLLIFVISNLTKPQTDEDGRGCYATNAYLASAASVHPMHVSKRIQHLNDLKILLIVNSEGRRYIEVEWTRTSEERVALAGQYGIDYRKAYAEMFPNGKPDKPFGEGGKPFGLEGKSEGLVTHKPKGLVTHKPKGLPIYADESDSGEEDTHCSTKLIPSSNGHSNSIDGFYNGNKQTEPQLLADKFHQILIKHNKIMRRPNLKQWATQMEIILNKYSYEEIIVAFDWYDNHITEEYCPKIYCADTLVEKYPQLLDAIDRSRRPKKTNRYLEEWDRDKNILRPEERC